MVFAVAPAAVASVLGNDVVAKAKPEAAYGADTAPVPPVAVARRPNCSVPIAEAVFEEPIGLMVKLPYVSVVPLAVMVYPLAAFVPATMLCPSTSVVSPEPVLEAKRAATAESVPKLIVVVEIVKVIDCGTVPEIFTWLLFTITLVKSPVSPGEVTTVAVYDPALLGLVELALEYVMITLSFGARTAAPTPSVGVVRVIIRFAVPENATPQAVALGVPAKVSVVSRPVETPCVKVILEVALPVKS